MDIRHLMKTFQRPKVLLSLTGFAFAVILITLIVQFKSVIDDRDFFSASINYGCIKDDAPSVQNILDVMAPNVRSRYQKLLSRKVVIVTITQSETLKARYVDYNVRVDYIGTIKRSSSNMDINLVKHCAEVNTDFARRMLDMNEGG